MASEDGGNEVLSVEAVQPNSVLVDRYHLLSVSPCLKECGNPTRTL